MQSPKKHTNRLANETSPYLLQHAHNPVDWYPWGEEAFRKAADEDKPILLSIGYSACHWCHVMERESFEDERVAGIMNDHFVNIKVDMEERPDVDKIYMNFVQMTTGSGGWPMTVFLTPDQRPFFGGTYFPPTPRYNLPSFEQILVSVAQAYADNRDEVLRSANDILGEIRRIGLLESSSAGFGRELLERAYKSFERSFDLRNGGFGGAPKFPAPMTLEFLLRYHKKTGEPRALEMVTTTCQKMAHGGIFDQLGGGFHRYTVDANWLTPHFEKMLYDNAQLAKLYVHVFQQTKDPFFERIARETLDYVLREMTDASGGFYSSEDADSEGVEGKFFTWTLAEVREVLGAGDAEVFARYFDVTEEGNFEGTNILNVKRSFAEVRSELSLDEAEMEAILTGGKQKLFAVRGSRVRPHRDEKVLAAWNGLMLSAFAVAGWAFGEDRYIEAAEANARFLLEDLTVSGRLLRSWKEGEAKLNGYVEDYANAADGLIDLYQATGRRDYLASAERLARDLVAGFWDEEAGGFFFTSDDHEELIVRSKDFNDNATPSGNSAAADVLLRLSKILSDETLERFALSTLRLVAPQIERYPGAFGRALSAMEFSLAPVKEVVVTGERNKDLEEVIAANYLPFKVVVRPGAEPDPLPLLQGRDGMDGPSMVYVCEDRTCKLPVSEPGALGEQLGV